MLYLLRKSDWKRTKPAGQEEESLMRGQKKRSRGWDEGRSDYNDAAGYGYGNYDDQFDEPGYDGYGQYGQWEDDEQGLVLQPEHSLVGVSNTVTHHGVPLLSYTRTMNRFYTTRKQRLSL